MNAVIEIPGFDEIVQRLERIESKLDERSDAAPDLLNVKQAAAHLGVTDQTIRAWAKLGKLEVANRVGRKMMFRRSDVETVREE